jgi:type III secretory pathway lipoprotein EscJ
MQRAYRRNSLVLFLCLFLFGCKAELVQNIEPKEAARMVSILSESGLTVYQKLQANGNWALSVDENQLLSAMTVLDQYRLTPIKNAADKEEKSIFPTPDEEKRFSEKKKSKLIEDTLRSLPSVLDARVLLTPPHSASVVIFAKPSFSVSEDEIKALVSGASGIPLSGIHSLLKKDAIPKIANISSGDEMSNPQNKIKWFIQIIVSIFLISIGVTLYKNKVKTNKF